MEQLYRKQTMMSLKLCFLFSFLVLISNAHLKCKEADPLLLKWNSTQIYGKWIYIGGVADDEETEKMLNISDSAWMDFQPLNNSHVTIWQTARIGEPCLNSTFYFNISEESGYLLLQAPHLTGRVFPEFKKCLHIYFIYEKPSNTTVRLHYLYSRTKNVRDSCMAEFKKRLQCYGISPVNLIIVPQLKEQCPSKEETEIKTE
ncbi:uncharacterized protein LOC122811414 [Protopterus annectens]|uniref:uncharacterized protein LOC122811414 n=1 Tax=Protopterus annectens TaxID=7888 RepID=UPI001CFBEE5B|nr:uncharacterized protein LOC122811414 [Protopterus annectens]